MTYEQHLVHTPTWTPKRPVRLPLNVLLALPDYVTADPSAPIFNFPALFARLLGNFGWERASRVARPWFWAPGWSDETFERFLGSPFVGGTPILVGNQASRLRVAEFPGLGSQSDLVRDDRPNYSVLHITCAVEWKDGERGVVLARDPMTHKSAAALRSGMAAADVRLLLLQVPSAQHQDGTELSKLLATSGGPSTVVVSAMDPAASQRYFSDVFAGIVHNRPLESVVRPRSSQEGAARDEEGGLRIDFIYDPRDLSSLRLDGYLGEVRTQLNTLETSITLARQRIFAEYGELRQRAEGRTHATQTRAIESRLESAADALKQIETRSSGLSQVLGSELDWAHESGGAEPLSRLAEDVAQLESIAAAAVEVSERVQGAVGEAIEQAPRVLNANFTDPSDRHIVGPMEGLAADRDYELLVDIGPRWSKIPSIVSGSADWPAESLPPDMSGYVVDVILMSDHFAPSFVTARMWVPRTHGRSRVMTSNGPDAKTGPVPLRVRTPALEGDAERQSVDARLFVYFANNLLQSALVTASVVRDPGQPAPTPNRVNVDYALSGTLARPDEKLAVRAIHTSEGEALREQPVRVNITLNHDGHGTHRIIVRGQELEHAWTAYDPHAARKSLGSARSALLDCFWERELETGKVVEQQDGTRPCALDEFNGKARDQFALDLFILAEVGRRLYLQMFASARPDASATSKAWEQRLRQVLHDSSVIQVARIPSTPTQYVFPWALLYEYPLSSPTRQWRYCDVVNEWPLRGARMAPVAARCPHASALWHQADVLCPYGFWGLKHVIEQPLVPVAADGARPKDVITEIRVEPAARFSVGWTRDAALDLPRVDNHVERLRRFPGLAFAGPHPNPAADREGVLKLSPKTDVLYFLCHCDRAVARDEPYLHLGIRDDDEARRIYSSTVLDWATSSLADWDRIHPLVVINGCHTGDLEPGEVLNFVSAFATAGASGVVGTDISVQLPVAIDIGERLIGKLLGPEGRKIGEALREVRWDLANRGNLLGLCYSAYGQADLAFVRAT